MKLSKTIDGLRGRSPPFMRGWIRTTLAWVPTRASPYLAPAGHRAVYSSAPCLGSLAHRFQSAPLAQARITLDPRRSQPGATLASLIECLKPADSCEKEQASAFASRRCPCFMGRCTSTGSTCQRFSAEGMPFHENRPGWVQMGAHVCVAVVAQVPCQLCLGEPQRRRAGATAAGRGGLQGSCHPHSGSCHPVTGWARLGAHRVHLAWVRY